MDTAGELDNDMAADARGDPGARFQPSGYLLELSFDWIVLRASENVHHLLGESHVTLIDEPLGRFVHAQALHDLRNLFSRLSGTTGIGRAYAVRLTDDHDLVDVAFHLVDGHVLLEAIPSSGCFGECFGSVGGLIAGLGNNHGQALLDGGARRMRALTGYDRVTLSCGERRAESSRGAFAILAKRRLVSQLSIGNFSERDVGMSESRRIFNQWPMAEAQLPHAARHHVHQDLLISNYFGRSFNEFGFHNWIGRESRGRRINSRTRMEFVHVPGNRRRETYFHYRS